MAFSCCRCALWVLTIVQCCRVWLLWFKFKSTQEKSTLPPLLSVSINISPLQRIKSRVSIYTARNSTTATKSAPSSVGPISPESQLEFLDDDALKDNDDLSPMCRRSTTVTFSPFAEPDSDITSPATDVFEDSSHSTNNDNVAQISPKFTNSEHETKDRESLSDERLDAVTPTNASANVLSRAQTSTGLVVHVDTDARPSVALPVRSLTSPTPVSRRSHSIFDDMELPPTPKLNSSSIVPQSSNSGQAPINWYLSHKHYGSDRFILKWFGLKGLLEWLVLMAPLATSGGGIYEESLSDECFCPSLAWALYAFQAMVAYHALIVGYASWRFGKYHFLF